MDESSIPQAVAAERRSLCDQLQLVDSSCWDTPSLCAGWSVKDVLAHLTTTTRTALPQVLLGALRAGGRFHRMTDRAARARSARFTPEELIAQLRETADSARRMPGSAPMDPLLDVLVHGQDITRPLQMNRSMPSAAAIAALDHVVGNAFYQAPRRLAGLAVEATDVRWSHGKGAHHVRGTAADLLLAITGRPNGLQHLTGSGVATLRARLNASPL
jgi:uncharacterized protein (TIGR03083 family)